MNKFDRGDQVQNNVFGIGKVEVDNSNTVIVRFQHGLEEIEKTELKKIFTPQQALTQKNWHSALEVILRVQAETIQSVNDSWGVFALSRIALLPHQLWVCRRVVEKQPTRWLVADDVGLGKTIEGGLILSSLMSRDTIKRVLIISPASLVTQWQIRLRTMFDIRFADYTADADHPDKDFWNTHNLVIVSLQTIRADSKGRHERLLNSEPWDLLIVDEAHHLNADEKMGPTLGYQLIEKMVKNQKISSMVFFTGTPHRGKDFGFLSLLKLLDDRFNPKTEMQKQLQYLPEVMIRNNKQNVTDLKGDRLFQAPKVTSEIYTYSEAEAKFYRKLTEFIIDGKAYASSLGVTEGQLVILVLITMQKLASSSVAAIRRALKGRLSRIVEGQKQLSKLERQLAEYRENEENGDMDRASQLEEDILELSAELRLMENEEIQLEELVEAADEVKDETKLRTIIAVMKERFVGRSVLFFTEYKATQSKLISYLMKEFGEHSVTFINGDDAAVGITNPSGKEISIQETRENAAEKFRTGQARFLVSTEAGGEGIDLQEHCFTLIHVDLPWNPMRLHQRVGRLNRYGQTHQVEVLTLRNPETVESIIWDKLNTKIEMIKVALNQVMDEPEDLLQLVLGMTSSSFFNNIFSDANNVSGTRLSDWFDQKTAQFGGKDALETVRTLVGNASRFDFQEVSERLPKVDLPDMAPFFTTMIQNNSRRITRETDDEISFKTPELWLTEPAIRRDYKRMVFTRNIHGKNAAQRILGVGQKVVQKALEQAKGFESSICTLPSSILNGPIFVFRAYDRITASSNTLRSAIIGLNMDSPEDQSGGLLFDWQILLKLNEMMTNRIKKDSISNPPKNIQEVTKAITHAEEILRKNISSFDLPFKRPELELLAVMWPETEIHAA
jgi:ERCC4-related helicase